MGYRTYYSLDVLDVDDAEACVAIVRMTSDEARMALDEHGGTDHEVKWHDHEAVMAAVSRAYPKALFALWGNGETTPDLWVKYFKNGRVQRAWAKITYAEFNEDELEKPKSDAM